MFKIDLDLNDFFRENKHNSSRVVFNNVDDFFILNFSNDFFKSLFTFEEEKVEYSKRKIPIGIRKDNGKPFYIDLSETFRMVITGRTRTGKTFLMRAFADRLKKSGFYHTFFLPDTKNEFYSSFKPVQDKFRSGLLKGEVPFGYKILALRPTIFKNIDFGSVPRGNVYFSVGLDELSRSDFLTLLDAKNKTSKQRAILEVVFDKVESARNKGLKVDFDIIMHFLDELLDEDKGVDESSIMALKSYFKPLVSSNFIDEKHFLDIISLMENDGFSFSLNVMGFEYLKVNNIVNLFFMIVLSKLINARRKIDIFKDKSNALSKPLFLFVDEAPRFIPVNAEPVGKNFLMESVDLDTRFGVYYVFATQELSKLPEKIINQSRYVLVPYTSNVEEFRYVMVKGGFASNVQVAKNEAIRLKNSMNKFEWVCFDMNLGSYVVFKSLSPLSYHVETSK